MRGGNKKGLTIAKKWKRLLYYFGGVSVIFKNFVGSLIVLLILSLSALVVSAEETPPDELLPPGATEEGEGYDVSDYSEIVKNKPETNDNGRHNSDGKGKNDDGTVGTECIVCGVPDSQYDYTAKKIYGPAYVEKFDQYLTGVWAYSDGYTWGTTTTTNLSFSGSISSDIAGYIQSTFGYTKSRSRSYSVSISLPADPSKSSKLGLYGDFNRDYVYYTKSKYGSTVDSGYTYTYEPTNDQTLKVVYRY